MNFGNSKKKGFLESIPTCSIESETDILAQKGKFNFSYFDCSQDAADSFNDWSKENLVQLYDKLKEYGKFPLEHWTRTKVGHGKNHILEIYGSFPIKSDFTHPKHVPHQAQWARFRIDRTTRLIGFTIEKKYHGVQQRTTGYEFCSNTFYVVFLDSKHGFYKK
ncbi:hypothetical protein [Vibrio fluvialis]|uniref:hypothetical protein n=1 Tax=Vibrio fluvialis TaxID=676 RepID=UPI001EECCF2C|nr:hypothetical protein [Vibrio fluvialis]MCG6390274.1 hypothetical protein [Vibrio fluvialis]